MGIELPGKHLKIPLCSKQFVIMDWEVSLSDHVQQKRLMWLEGCWCLGCDAEKGNSKAGRVPGGATARGAGRRGCLLLFQALGCGWGRRAAHRAGEALSPSALHMCHCPC